MTMHHVCAGEVQKTLFEPLELKLQLIVSHHGVLETKPLEEQSMLLTTEPSVQIQEDTFLIK